MEQLGPAASGRLGLIVRDRDAFCKASSATAPVRAPN